MSVKTIYAHSNTHTHRLRKHRKHVHTSYTHASNPGLYNTSKILWKQKTKTTNDWFPAQAHKDSHMNVMQKYKTTIKWFSTHTHKILHTHMHVHFLSSYFLNSMIFHTHAYIHTYTDTWDCRREARIYAWQNNAHAHAQELLEFNCIAGQQVSHTHPHMHMQCKYTSEVQLHCLTSAAATWLSPSATSTAFAATDQKFLGACIYT